MPPICAVYCFILDQKEKRRLADLVFLLYAVKSFSIVYAKLSCALLYLASGSRVYICCSTDTWTELKIKTVSPVTDTLASTFQQQNEKKTVPRMKPMASIPATRSTGSFWNGLRRSCTQSARAWGEREPGEMTGEGVGEGVYWVVLSCRAAVSEPVPYLGVAVESGRVEPRKLWAFCVWGHEGQIPGFSSVRSNSQCVHSGSICSSSVVLHDALGDPRGARGRGHSKSLISPLEFMGSLFLKKKK